MLLHSILTTCFWELGYHALFSNKKAEIQIIQIVWPRSHSWGQAATLTQECPTVEGAVEGRW